MTMTTTRYGLPLLVPGQAQKEMFHNEALAAIDVLLHPAVEAVGLDAPPAAPAEGQSWIAGPNPTGEWTGRAHHLASWTSGGWRFREPVAGLTVTIVDDRLQAAWDGARWIVGTLEAERLIVGGRQVVGAQRPAIADPAGGATADAEARAALSAALAALRAHGLIA